MQQQRSRAHRSLVAITCGSAFLGALLVAGAALAAPTVTLTTSEQAAEGVAAELTSAQVVTAADGSTRVDAVVKILGSANGTPLSNLAFELIARDGDGQAIAANALASGFGVTALKGRKVTVSLTVGGDSTAGLIDGLELKISRDAQVASSVGTGCADLSKTPEQMCSQINFIMRNNCENNPLLGGRTFAGLDCLCEVVWDAQKQCYVWRCQFSGHCNWDELPY